MTKVQVDYRDAEDRSRSAIVVTIFNPDEENYDLDILEKLRRKLKRRDRKTFRIHGKRVLE